MNLHEICMALQLAGENGGGDVDLSDYYTKSQTDSLISGKVDKIDGMGLSENNFTDAEKSKLAGLENTLSTVNDRLTTLELGSSGSSGSSNNIVTLSQSEYDALSTKAPDTIYMIAEEGD
ncbi:MAG: hypothetical protein K2K91_09530 [Ruminococcus sp.]|nr:hypothetical protein [Ruminococcus sp.]